MLTHNKQIFLRLKEVCLFWEMWLISDSMLKKCRQFIFPKSSASENKHIFVKNVLILENVLILVCLLWGDSTIKNYFYWKFEFKVFVSFRITVKEYGLFLFSKNSAICVINELYLHLSWDVRPSRGLKILF